MELFEKVCACCGKPLTPDDDIVVCPECGAPYHRACFEKTGKCLFADKHAEGYTWAPARPKAVEEAELSSENPEGVRTQLCMHCYTQNDADALFCRRCGAPMKESKAGAEQASPKEEAGSPLAGSLYADLLPEPVRPDELFDGVQAKDWDTYLGSGSPYYLAQFKRMDKFHRKTSFCWSAVFFAPLYFAYRKTWLWALVSMVVSFVLSLPQMFYMLGLSGSSVVVPLTENQILNLMMISNILSWVAQIAWGVFATYLVRRTSAKRLQKMQTELGSAQAFSEWTQQHGGASRLGVVLMVLAFLAFGAMFSLMMGPNMANVYSLYL